MSKQLSPQAQVAKLARTYCKGLGLKCTATSSSFAGGNSVDVTLYDQPPTIFKQVKAHLDQYQYGHFNGQEDIYEYSNSRDDIPQTKYLSIGNDTSDELEQACWAFLRPRLQDADEHPEILKDIGHSARVFDEWVHSLVYQVLGGNRLEDLSAEFWAEYLKAAELELVPALAADPARTVAFLDERDCTVSGVAVRPGTREGYSEIVFPGKPAEEVRTQLKAAGFRWSSRNACWYGKTDRLPEELSTGSGEGEGLQDNEQLTTYVRGYAASKGDTKTATKLRELADKLQPQIDDKLRDRETNTAKRIAQAAHARLEGQRLERTQSLLKALADRHEAGTVPELLSGVRSKKHAYDLVRGETTPCQNGYHGYRIETGEPADSDDVTLAAWALLVPKSEEEIKAEDLRAKIQALQFAKIPGYFPTQGDAQAYVLQLAGIREGHKVLEPSAGSGHLADAIREAGHHVVCGEINFTLRSILELKGHTLVFDDFIGATKDNGHGYEGPLYDRVVQNPPFENLQDIDHIRAAYSVLKPGGRLVSVASAGPFFRQDRKCVEFRDWLENLGAFAEQLPEGSFKESGTLVNSYVVVIDKTC